MSVNQVRIQQNYLQIIEAFPCGMILVDVEGKIVLVNHLVEKMFGYNREELILQSIECLLPEQFRQLGAGHDLHGLRKDKSGFLVEIGLNPLEIEGRNYTLVNIEERIRSELEYSKDFLNRIINNIASPIFVKDQQHHWILLNDAYCKFMGYPREELIGKSDIDFFPKEEVVVFWQKDQLVFESGQININEEMFTDARGEHHIILTKKVPFVQENGEKILVGIINDITDLKNNERRVLHLNEELKDSNEKLKSAYDRLQEAQDKMMRSERLVALGEMAAMVGHELRNSLGVIRNSAYYLKLRIPDLTQEQKILKYLDILEEEVRISDKVISDILTFNRIKQLVLRKDNINAIILGEIEKINFPQAIHKVLNLDQSLPAIDVDADQLRHVFANIISNAIDAMPGGGQFTVKTALEGEWMAVTFTDTGVGITEENLSKIFKPGFTTKHHGTGLGLAICAGILALHNGKIEARSQFGKGTQIIVYLSQKEVGHG